LTRRAWTLAACLVAFGCKDLPEIEPGVCGNGVLEPPEDCDGFPVDGVVCREPGSSGECRLDCSPDETGTGGPCPAGWGCIASGICRPATGKFTMVGEDIAGNTISLLSGDFDGDGKDDVVGIDGAVTFGLTNLRVHYFDGDAKLSRTWTSDKRFASPAVADVSDDGRADITYSNGSIGVLAGESNRSLVPEMYPSYFVGEGAARTIVVNDEQIEDSAPFVILAERDGMDQLFVADTTTLSLLRIAETEGGVEELAAEPVVGRLHDDVRAYPCKDFALAYYARTAFSVYSVCEEGATGTSFSKDPEIAMVALEPPAELDGGVIIADIDGDGHNDVLVSTADGPYLAAGNGNGVGAARPHRLLPAPEDEAPLGFPLAGGDLDEDGIAELVFPDGLAIAFRDPESGRVFYARSHAKFGAPWSEAVFADFNADGKLDLACASNVGLNVDFFNGTGTIGVNPFVIRTDRPVRGLAVGEFDGDLINDVAFVELRNPSREEEQISIAFGGYGGPPDPPVPAIHLEHVEQIASFEADVTTVLTNLVVLSEERDAAGNSQRALGFLVGSSDRSLPAPIELTTFADDGSLQTWTSLAVAVGSFLQPDRVDLVPFGIIRDPTRDDLATWFLEDVTGRESAPRLIGSGLAPGMAPLGGPLGENELSIRLSAGDLDGDQLSELVLIAPNEDGDRCLASVSRVSASPEPSLVELQTLSLDAPCYDAAVDVFDLDGDQAPELVLLLGGPNTRELTVLWNDGSGGFDENEASSLAVHGESPRAFTHFRAPDSSTMLAYVTSIGVRLLRSRGAERAFDDAGSVAQLGNGTGIVAADVNGDRIVDLAVTDFGGIRVLRAEVLP
jgi:hypothetical protein